MKGVHEEHKRALLSLHEAHTQMGEVFTAEINGLRSNQEKLLQRIRRLEERAPTDMVGQRIQ